MERLEKQSIHCEGKWENMRFTVSTGLLGVTVPLNWSILYNEGKWKRTSKIEFPVTMHQGCGNHKKTVTLPLSLQMYTEEEETTRGRGDTFKRLDPLVMTLENCGGGRKKNKKWKSRVKLLAARLGKPIPNSLACTTSKNVYALYLHFFFFFSSWI